MNSKVKTDSEVDLRQKKVKIKMNLQGYIEIDINLY